MAMAITAMVFLSSLPKNIAHLESMTTALAMVCLLYTSDAADDLLCVDLGGRRIIKKKNKDNHYRPIPNTPKL